MEFLDWAVYGNTIRLWIVAVLTGLAVIVVMRLIQSVVQQQLARLASRTTTDIDDVIQAAVVATRGWYMLIVGIWAASLTLSLPRGWATAIGAVTLLATLVQIGLWGTTMIRAYVAGQAVRRVEVDAASVTTIKAIGFLLSVALWLILFLVALDTHGVDVTALVAGLGVGGIAVALAVQNILGDLFASLSIVLDKPFVYGDFIVVDTLSGTVEHVGLKTTRVRSLSGEQLVFSNSDLLSSRIRNYKRMTERRISFTLGVVYQTPRATLERIPEMLRSAVEAQPDTRLDRAHMKGFGASSIDYEIVYYVLSAEYGTYMDRQQSINLEILRLFQEAGIDFAYPTQTLFVTAEPAEQQ